MDHMELVIENPRWLNLVQRGDVTVWEALRNAYDFRLSVEACDWERNISIVRAVKDGKRIGRFIYTQADNDTLKRGEAIDFLLI